MRKWIAFLCCLMLAQSLLTGCAGQSPSAVGQTPDPKGAVTVAPSDKSTSGVTLAAIRKAAEDSGYKVTDGHKLAGMKEVKDGFSVQIKADGQDTIYSIIECKTEEAAVKNAQDIDAAGYNIAIRNGKFLTCYAKDKKDGTIKDILATLLSGKAKQP